MRVEFLVVNPTLDGGHPSIALKEYLPRLRDNPYALQGRGFEILRNGKPVDPGSHRLDPAAFRPMSPSARHRRAQRPWRDQVHVPEQSCRLSARHTPKKDLFGEQMRAYSAGCVRVQDPFALAEMVLGGADGGWPKSGSSG